MKIFNKLIVFLMIALVLGCGDTKFDQPQPNGNSSLNEGASEQPEISGRMKTTSGSGEGTEYTDATGTIHLKMFYTTTTQAQHNSESATLPSDYVLVGGSAVIYTELPYFTPTPMVLLTESRPDFANNRWVASSKDHIVTGYHVLRVEAIGLRIDGVSAAQLKSYMQVVSNTSAVASHPSTSTTLPSGYLLVGGGAKSNYTGAGNLLTASYPIGSSWIAESKDHGVADPASITSYAIGIQSFIPGYGNLATTVLTNSESVPTATHSLDTGASGGNSTGTCAGARATYNGSGRLLNQILTRNYFGSMRSKDHQWADSGVNYAYLITLSKL